LVAYAILNETKLVKRQSRYL